MWLIWRGRELARRKRDVLTMGSRRGSDFCCGKNWIVLSVWIRSRGIYYNLPLEGLCVLMETGKEDKGLVWRK